MIAPGAFARAPCAGGREIASSLQSRKTEDRQGRVQAVRTLRAECNAVAYVSTVRHTTGDGRRQVTGPKSKTAEALQQAVAAARLAGREDIVERLLKIAKLLPAQVDGVEAE